MINPIKFTINPAIMATTDSTAEALPNILLEWNLPLLEWTCDCKTK
jgi:hypothetical protein